jgi:hypothetical protein
MIHFFNGAAMMYMLAAILLLYITEASDEDNPNAPLKLAVMWPIITILTMLEHLWYLIVGDRDD